MIYLFCSASKPLYKRDALESSCYPPGHLFRFRYDNKYVDPSIWAKPKAYAGEKGVIVFLDSIGSAGQKNFAFFPLRMIRTVRLFPEGSAIYVDFRLGDFINFGAEGDNTLEASFKHFFESLPNRPWPPPEESGRKKPGDTEGYFIVSNLRGNPVFPTKCRIAHEAWENLIRRLNKTSGLSNSTFFQVLGFYKIRRAVPLIWNFSEVPINAKDNSFDSIYPLPMGKSVILKLLFSRPSFDPTKEYASRTLELKIGSEAFVGASKTVIHSESRYNEERIVLVCKRVFDSFMATVSIEQQQEPATILAPKPFFLTRIKVPRFVIGIVILGVVVSTLLLGLDADSVKLAGTWLIPNHAKFFEDNSKVLSTLMKAVAPLPIGLSTYLAFRKLPLK